MYRRMNEWKLEIDVKYSQVNDCEQFELFYTINLFHKK